MGTAGIDATMSLFSIFMELLSHRVCFRVMLPKDLQRENIAKMALKIKTTHPKMRFTTQTETTTAIISTMMPPRTA